MTSDAILKQTLKTEPRLVDNGFYNWWYDAIVRHADLDPNNHVTNSVICSWFDDGRYTFLVNNLRPLMPVTDFLALGTVTIDFHQEVKLFHRPQIGTAILKLGRSSIVMGQAIFCDGQCVATATSVTIIADGDTRRSKEMTGPQREALVPYITCPDGLNWSSP